MADPKFANLPGIAYDQPDVYETPDIPDPDATSDYYEEETENECIERLHISTKDSYNRFKGKHLSGANNVDFSEKLGRHRTKNGYDSWTVEYELVGEGEKENPVQKCRRLQCELKELMDEITALQVDKQISKEEKESYEAVATVVNTAKKVLDSLRLEEVLGKEEVSKQSTQSEVKTLLNQVDEFKKSGILTPIKHVDRVEGGNTIVGSGGGGGNELAQSTRIATLEHKLHQLEHAIGVQRPERLSRLAATVGTTNLLEAVQQLTTKAALLQPTQLDLIEARLSTLATKMDAIAEKATNISGSGNGGGSGSGSSNAVQDTQRDQKVLELYEIAKRTEPIAQILPDMLERMQALEALHKYATNFTKIIAELEATQNTIATGIANNKALLQGVQDAFAQNLENVNKEIAKLETRITTMTLKIK